MLNKEILINIFKKLLQEAKKSYDDFNTADGKIGDGDLGVTVLRGLEEINKNSRTTMKQIKKREEIRHRNKEGRRTSKKSFGIPGSRVLTGDDHHLECDHDHGHQHDRHIIIIVIAII